MHKISIIIFFTSVFGQLSCTPESNPIIPPGPSNPFAQTAVEWPSLRKSPWPMYRHDPQLSGRTTHSGPAAGIIAESLTVGYEIASVVIDSDSEFFVSASRLSTIYNLTKWKYDTALIWGKHYNAWDTYNAPVLTSSGDMVYCTPQKLIRLTNDTSETWVHTLYPTFTSLGTTIDKEGNIYLKRNITGGILVISPDGSLLYTIPTPPGSTILPPAFSPDGKRLYISDSRLTAIDLSTKQVAWTGDSVGILTSPVVDCQGNIYFFAKEGSVNGGTVFKSVAPDGTTRWSSTAFTAHKSIYAIEPVIDWNGNVYFCYDTLYSFTNDGQLRWKLGLGVEEKNYCSLTCDGANTVYVLTTRDNIYSVGSTGAIRWKVNITHGLFSNAPSIADGRLFVPSFPRGQLYIIK